MSGYFFTRRNYKFSVTVLNTSNVLLKWLVFELKYCTSIVRCLQYKYIAHICQKQRNITNMSKHLITWITLRKLLAEKRGRWYCWTWFYGFASYDQNFDIYYKVRMSVSFKWLLGYVFLVHFQVFQCLQTNIKNFVHVKLTKQYWDIHVQETIKQKLASQLR